MIPVLPVSMIPVAARAATPAGFVLAVVIGLAVFAVSQKANQPQTEPQR